jgi:hypothetical protein
MKWVEEQECYMTRNFVLSSWSFWNYGFWLNFDTSGYSRLHCICSSWKFKILHSLSVLTSFLSCSGQTSEKEEHGWPRNMYKNDCKWALGIWIGLDWLRIQRSCNVGDIDLLGSISRFDFTIGTVSIKINLCFNELRTLCCAQIEGYSVNLCATGTVVHTSDFKLYGTLTSAVFDYQQQQVHLLFTRGANCTSSGI